MCQVVVPHFDFTCALKQELVDLWQKIMVCCIVLVAWLSHIMFVSSERHVFNFVTMPS